MKLPLFLFAIAPLFLGGCGAPQRVAVAPVVAPTASPTAAVAPPTVAPAATPRIVQGKRSSLPDLPQMMDPSIPRPTFIPLPTPTPRPTPVVPATPTPRQNSTIVVSNAPMSASEINPQEAAAREMVWVDTESRIYHRPGSRFYGTTQQGFYLTETQARGRGFRLSLR